MKRFPVAVRHSVALLAMVVFALTLSTCISAEQHDYVIYDPAKDEFQMLTILADIRGKDEDDLAYLAAIYKNRDHLIAPALPGGANAISMFPYSFLRMSSKQLVGLNIYGSRPSSLEALEIDAPLETVQIRPGTFFVQNNKLGFYQAITVPGKAIDAALVAISKELQSSDMADSVQKEIDRRKNGGKTVTWAQVTAQSVKDIQIKPATTAPASEPATAPSPDEDPQPQYALEMASLTALKQAITDKSLRITRDKQKFVATLPLTAKDGAAAAELYKAVVARMQEVIAATKETPEVAEDLQQARVMQAVTSALTLAGSDKGLTATLDLPAAAKAIAALPAKRIDLNDKDNAAATPPDALKYLKDHGITIDATITPEQILKDFNAGTLKTFPSVTPVKPGEGIATPKEPTTAPTTLP